MPPATPQTRTNHAKFFTYPSADKLIIECTKCLLTARRGISCTCLARTDPPLVIVLVGCDNDRISKLEKLNQELAAELKKDHATADCDLQTKCSRRFKKVV